MGELEAMIAACQALCEIPASAAREAVPLIEAAIKKTAAAGTDPNGKPWAPKKDGSRPMINAASHITAAAAGTVVRVTLKGPDVFHNYGARSTRRQVLPDQESDTPPAIVAAIDEGVARALSKAMAR